MRTCNKKEEKKNHNLFTLSGNKFNYLIKKRINISKLYLVFNLDSNIKKNIQKRTKDKNKNFFKS